MKPALSQVCSLDSSLESDVADYAAGQCGAIEFWLTKLEDYLKSHSVEQFNDLLAEHEVQIAAASYQGGLLGGDDATRKESWDLFVRRLDLCAELSVPTIVVACDAAGPISQQTIELVQKGLGDVAIQAGQRGIRAAIEFQARSTFGNNLQTGAALIHEIGSPHLGVCLDLFHYWVGSSKTEDLDYLTAANLFHVQVCDLAERPRELAADSDRILPGDGDIPMQQVVEHLRTIGYEGYVSVELMNPQIWRVPALQFGEIAMTSLRKMLGQAAMN